MSNRLTPIVFGELGFLILFSFSFETCRRGAVYIEEKDLTGHLFMSFILEQIHACRLLRTRENDFKSFGNVY